MCQCEGRGTLLDVGVDAGVGVGVGVGPLWGRSVCGVGYQHVDK